MFLEAVTTIWRGSVGFVMEIKTLVQNLANEEFRNRRTGV